jgi:hypothetical protein
VGEADVYRFDKGIIIVVIDGFSPMHELVIIIALCWPLVAFSDS